MLNRLFRLFAVGHFDERKTSRSPSLSILDDADRCDFPVLLKCGSQVFIGTGERKVPYINICHRTNPNLFHQWNNASQAMADQTG